MREWSVGGTSLNTDLYFILPLSGAHSPRCILSSPRLGGNRRGAQKRLPHGGLVRLQCLLPLQAACLHRPLEQSADEHIDNRSGTWRLGRYAIRHVLAVDGGVCGPHSPGAGEAPRFAASPRQLSSARVEATDITTTTSSPCFAGVAVSTG